MNAVRPLQGVCLLLGGLVIGSGWAAAAPQDVGPNLDFQVPAQAAGNLTATASWAAFVFSEASMASLHLDFKGPVSGANHTRLDVQAKAEPRANSWVPQDLQDQAVAVVDDLNATLQFRNSWSFVLVQADSLRITASDTSTLLRASTGNSPLADFATSDEIGSPQVFPHDPAPLVAGAALTVQSGKPHAQVPFQLEVRGLRRVEWHNTTTTCAQSRCPDGARAYGPAAPLPGGSAHAEIMPYIDLHAANGTLQGGGSALYMVVVGPGMDLGLLGRARFPQAMLNGDCGSKPCPDPAGRTLETEGDLLLGGLSLVPGAANRLQTRLGGSVYQARFDEKAIPELATRAALVGGAALGLAILAWALWPLFARNTRPLLDHPLAKAIHDLVHANPGLNQREIEERAQSTHGATQYHLRRLLQAGLIVSKYYRNSTRYYENHGRHKQDWQEYAVLQKPELRQLHTWIAQHPNSTQSQVIAATAKWGWTRSTTQNRLRQLQEASLIRDHRTAAETVEYTVCRLSRSTPF